MDIKRKPAQVDVRIGELRLTGFSAPEGRRIGYAVERELARLMAKRGGIGDGARSVARIDAGTLRFPRGARAETAGARIAAAIYRSIMRGPK